MRAVLPPLIAGLGLFFLGLELVSSGLQESASRTLRIWIRRSTTGFLSRVAVGVAAGAVIQSTSAVVTVLGSLATSGLVTLDQAIPIVAFANIGTTALVFASAIDIRAVVLFVVGIAGISYSMTTEFTWKAVSAVALGVALFLHGGDLMTAATADVEQASWFAGFLHSFHGSGAMAFGLGTIASFIAGSTAAVALMSITLANGGFLDLSEATMMVYGANLGTTLLRMLLSRGYSGTLRQVSRFQDGFKIAATAIFTVLFVIEHWGGVPLVDALVSAITPRLALQLALVNFILNGSMALATTLLNPWIVPALKRQWPSSVAEALSVPEYLSHDAVHDPATAIDLLEKEQMRALKRTREYLSACRPVEAGTDRIDPAALHKSFGVLFREMEHFQTALLSQHIDIETSERLGNAQARQKLLELIEDSLQQLALSVVSAPASGKLESLTGNFVEALDFLLMFAGDAARTLDRGRAEFLFELSSDRGEMMGSVRSLHLAPDQALSAEEKALLLRLTTVFERTVWMLQRYAELLLKNVGPAEDSPATGSERALSLAAVD